MKLRVLCLAVLCGLGAGCGADDATAPGSSDASITYTLNGTRYRLSGSLSSSLTEPFVVARADSVGGFVVVGYETGGKGKGDLLVLQGPRQTGGLQCAVAGTPCHGRMITGITGSNTSSFDRFFAITSGTVNVTAIGPERLRAHFSVTLQANDSLANGTLVIQDGSIDVPYLADPQTDGSLECLLSRVGVGSGSCRN